MFAPGWEIESAFTNIVATAGLSDTVSCAFEVPGLWGVPSDAEFFIENRYPTLFLTHAHDNSRYHSSDDTVSTLNLTYLRGMVTAIAGTAAQLAVPVDRNPLEVIEVVNSD